MTASRTSRSNGLSRLRSNRSSSNGFARRRAQRSREAAVERLGELRVVAVDRVAGADVHHAPVGRRDVQVAGRAGHPHPRGRDPVQQGRRARRDQRGQFGCQPVVGDAARHRPTSCGTGGTRLPARSGHSCRRRRRPARCPTSRCPPAGRASRAISATGRPITWRSTTAARWSAGSTVSRADSSRSDSRSSTCTFHVLSWVGRIVGVVERVRAVAGGRRPRCSLRQRFRVMVSSHDLGCSASRRSRWERRQGTVGAQERLGRQILRVGPAAGDAQRRREHDVLVRLEQLDESGVDVAHQRRDEGLVELGSGVGPSGWSPPVNPGTARLVALDRANRPTRHPIEWRVR